LPELARTWWLADFVGALVVVPLALAWAQPPRHPRLRGFGLELVLMLAVVAGLTELALRNGNPLTYLVYPGLLWCALRFGQRGATLAIAEAVGLTVWNVTHHRDVLAFTSITHTVLEVQLFIAVYALSTLFLVALVSEREEFAERLGASRAQLLHASDSARERIERDLHDGAQQRLVSLAVQLHLAAELPGTGDDTRAAIDAAEEDLQTAIDELRELAHGTYPSVLADLGLAHAINRIAAGSDLPITLHELPTTRLDENVEATAYFVVAEAVTNARKYAAAHEIHVRARINRGWLRIAVLDDGVGGAEVRPAAGLSGLRDRVEQAGGRFQVVSSRGHGTRVTAALPLH
jgi:signal transduction histidine kinase